MMNRNKIIVIVVLVFAVLACGAVSWLLVRSIVDKTEAEKQRDLDSNALTKIYASEVFPSEENIERVKADQKDLEEWLSSVAEQLHKGDLPEVKLTPATFKQGLQESVRVLSRNPGAKKGKVVTANFHFGFDQYLGESNELPKSDDVQRLAVQLGMIEKICRELFDARILSLDAITRETFDSATESVGQSQQSRAPSRRRARSQSDERQDDSENETVANQIDIPDGLVSRENFTFEFTASPEAYISALNKLSSMDLFIVIAENSFVKTGDQLERLTLKTKAKVDVGADKKISEMNHFERTVTDPLADLPVSVKLVLNVYSFKGV